MIKVIRKILFLTIFFLIYILSSSQVYAKCLGFLGGCTWGGEDCDTSKYDCDQYLLNITEDECHAMNGCQEHYTCGQFIPYTDNYCFLPIGASAPPQETCGIVGRKCCGEQGTWYCNEGNPQEETIGLGVKNCYCVTTLPPVTVLSPQTCGNCIPYDDCRKGGKSAAECLAPCGIQTALGCFPSEPQAMITWLVKLFIPLAAGIAFLLMVYGAFLLMTSSGDPEKVKKGSEILFSALAGLLFIIFSVFLLRLIGVTILAIPGFS